MKIREGEDSFDKRSDGFGRISPFAPKKAGERRHLVPGFQNINGAQLFPPLRGKAPSYGDARALVRRHMVTARHYKPRIERYPITLATENEPYPSIPNAMAIKVSHGKDGPIEEPRLAHFEFYSMDRAQDIKPKLTTFGLFREARITNGLDRDSLDPESPWFFDWVTLERLPPGVAILIEKSLRMREILEPKTILRPSSRCRINREITFDCPHLLSMIGQSVGCNYYPLRQYGDRDLRVDRLPSFKPGQSRSEPRNPYAHYLEEAPLQARLFAWRGSGPWEQDPFYPGRFGPPEKPFCWMLETTDPRSGAPITRRIKSDLELRRAVDLVRCQYAEGLRYALSSFDADYLIACLPLPFRRKLADRCIGYQQDVRDFLSQYSLSPRLDHFNLALEGTVRNSERIIRALIERQQALLKKGARLSDLPTQIKVSGDLLQVFLEAELKNLKKRETRITSAREFLPPELPDKTSSLFIAADRENDALASLREQLKRCRVSDEHLPKFEEAFRRWHHQRDKDSPKRELEKRRDHARRLLKAGSAGLPFKLLPFIPTADQIETAAKANAGLDLARFEEVLMKIPYSSDDRRLGDDILDLIDDLYALELDLVPLVKEYFRRRKQLSRDLESLDAILQAAWPERFET